MASELIVQTLKGPTSGSNANKVIIPSGQTLDIDAWTPPTGTVLQVVNATTTSQVANTTTTYADNGLSASITPSSTSSKILILVAQSSYTYRQTNDTHGYNVRLLRGTVTIYENERASMLNAGTSGNGYQELYSILNFSYLDSPATTSEITYKNQAKAFDSGNNGAITSQPGSRPSVMTLMEITG